MRIAVAGLNASGKTEVVSLLERRGFYRSSLSDVIREDLRAEELPPTRERMIERGRALRERFGLGVLAKRALRSLPPDRNHVMDSIRHPAEIESLRGAGDLMLLWVEASPEVRFARSVSRARPGDPATLEEFLELEGRELSTEEAAGQKLLGVRELADEVIANDADLARLESRLDELLEGRLLFRERPSWDAYFMSIARVVATRSNCIKRKVGSIITSDRRIISTGYNGTRAVCRIATRAAAPAATARPSPVPAWTSVSAATPRRTPSHNPRITAYPSGAAPYSPPFARASCAPR